VINKQPNLIDFSILRAVAKPFEELTQIEKFLSNHKLIILTLSTIIIEEERRIPSNCRKTDWEEFCNQDVK